MFGEGTSILTDTMLKSFLNSFSKVEINLMNVPQLWLMLEVMEMARVQTQMTLGWCNTQI
jgi:hypothetical protein